MVRRVSGLRRTAVVAALAAGVLMVTAAPAHAGHFGIRTQSMLVPTPWDAGGRDATIEVYRIGDRADHGYGVFRAYGERVTVTNTSGGWVEWRLIVSGMADPYGDVPTGSCVMWGTSRTAAAAAGCQWWGNPDIPEGVSVQLVVCVRTWHGRVCPTSDQQAKGRA